MGKKSTKTSSKTVYGNTTTTNPYVTSQTTNKGTVSNFNKGTAFDSINNFVNSNINSLLDSYMNPSLNTVTNQSKLNSFMNALNNNSAKSLENDIINPLSGRNMIRSSQATNLYNKLALNNAAQIGNYAQELLSNSQKDTASMLSNLMLWYLNGYGVLNDAQRQSLATSQGNASKTQSQSNGSNFSDMSQISQMAAQLALLSAGL